MLASLYHKHLKKKRREKKAAIKNSPDGSKWLLLKTQDQRGSELIFKHTVYMLNPVESKWQRKTQSGHISMAHKL